jgi:hypothetical protein
MYSNQRTLRCPAEPTGSPTGPGRQTSAAASSCTKREGHHEKTSFRQKIACGGHLESASWRL